MTDLDDRIRGWAAARRLPQAYLSRWLALEPADRIAMLELAEGLRMRTGQFVAAFDLVDEIALREGDRFAAIVGRSEIRRLASASGSGPGKAARLLDTLRALRYPRMKALSDRLTAALAVLRLPEGIRVVLPKDLASDELRIEIVAHGERELERLAQALAEKLDGLKRIAEMIGGADEV